MYPVQYIEYCNNKLNHSVAICAFTCPHILPSPSIRIRRDSQQEIPLVCFAIQSRLRHPLSNECFSNVTVGGGELDTTFIHVNQILPEDVSDAERTRQIPVGPPLPFVARKKSLVCRRRNALTERVRMAIEDLDAGSGSIRRVELREGAQRILLKWEMVDFGEDSGIFWTKIWRSLATSPDDAEVVGCGVLFQGRCNESWDSTYLNLV